MIELIIKGWDPVHTTPFSNENDTVLFRFENDSRQHLSFPYRFRPSTLQRVFVLKMLLNLIFFYILPPLLSSQKIKVVPLHWSSSWSCPESSLEVFSGLRPCRFYYPRSAQSWQAKQLYNIFKNSKRVKAYANGRKIVGPNMLRPFAWNHNTYCVQFETSQTFRPIGAINYGRNIVGHKLPTTRNNFVTCWVRLHGPLKTLSRAISKD